MKMFGMIIGSIFVLSLLMACSSAQAQGSRAQQAQARAQAQAEARAQAQAQARAVAEARFQAEAKAREEARALDRAQAKARDQAQRNAPPPTFLDKEKYVNERLDPRTAKLLEELKEENPTVHEHFILGMYMQMQGLTNTKVEAERHLYSFFVLGKFTADDKSLIYHRSFVEMSDNVKMIISPGGTFFMVVSNKSFVDDGDEVYHFGTVVVRMQKGHEPLTLVIPHLWYFKNIQIHTEKKKLPMSNIGELRLKKSENEESVVSSTEN